MDSLEKYQNIITSILSEYVKIPYANRQLETKLIIDKTAMNYIAMTLGWEGEERVHVVLSILKLLMEKSGFNVMVVNMALPMNL